MARQQATIGKKIGGGFGVVLLLTAMVTGIYQFALSSATSAFTCLIESEMAIAVRANAALNNLNKCRRYEKDFLLKGSQEQTGKQKDSFADLQDQLDTIEALAKKDNKTQLLEDVKKVGAAVELYQKNIELMFAAPESERLSIEQKVRDAARVAEPMLVEMYKNVQDEANQGTVEAVRQAKFLGWLAMVLGVIALASGATLAFFLGRGISTTLKQVSHSLNEGAEQVAAAAGEVSSSSQTLAEGASQQAAAV